MNKVDLVDKSLKVKKSDSLSYLEDVHAEKVVFEVDAGNVSTLSTKLICGDLADLIDTLPADVARRICERAIMVMHYTGFDEDAALRVAFNSVVGSREGVRHAQ